MTCWAIIPVKGSGEGKSRLASVLDDTRRHALVEAMLAHVVHAANNAGAISQVWLMGPAHDADLTIARMDDPGGGLNEALQTALTTAVDAGIARLIVLPADLPQVTSREIDLLAAAPEGSVVLAPDRHGIGTNALSLPLPAASGFAFAFGDDSLAAHRAESERLGLRVETIHSPGLARDIDLPADLPDAAALLT